MADTAKLLGDALISKADIASLARVHRPVVSMWISRFRRGVTPFPAAVRHRAGQDLFNVAEVVTWLELRGLGNNPSPATEAALYAVLAGTEQLPTRRLFDGLTALICLKELLGEQLSGLDDDDLIDQAEEQDPDDEFLFAEIEGLESDRSRLASFADALSDAAFTPAQAFESLMGQRFRLQLVDLADSALSDDALHLVSRVAAALATVGEMADGRAMDPTEVADLTFADPSTDSSDLLVSLGSSLEEEAEPYFTTGLSGRPLSRLMQRRLAVHGWRQRRDAELGFDEEFSLAGRAVFLAQFPSPSTVGMTEAQIIEAIDNIVVQMTDQHRGVIIAPAAALCDAPAAELDKVRDGVLRSNLVRAIVRLPEGLLTTQPGTAMALWVLGPSGDLRDLPRTQRWTCVADLSNTELDQQVIDGLITDVLAAMHDRVTASAHVFQFGQIVEMTRLLAGRNSLMVGRPFRPRQPDDAGAAAVVRIRELLDRVNDNQGDAGTELVLPIEHGQPAGYHLMSVGSLVKRKMLTLVPGNRIDEHDIGSDGGVHIIGPAELLEPRAQGGRTLDRLAFATGYPSGRYTEPGDIIVCTSPRFAVHLDQLGTSVVAYPARVIRVPDPHTTGLVPELIALFLAQSAPGKRPGRAIRSGMPISHWQLPVVSSDLVPEITDALRDLLARRAAAQQRINDVDELTQVLAQGLGRGNLTMTTRSTAAVTTTLAKEALHG